MDPGGTLFSPDPAVPAWILLLVGSVGPVGPCGTLSPSASESAILVDPGGMFPSSDLARKRGPAPPAGSAVLMGPVDPATDVCTCSPDGLRDASNRTPYRGHSSDTKCSKTNGTGIPGTIQTGTGLLEGQVFQLREYGTHTQARCPKPDSSLPL